MPALVTGATGFVGRQVVEELQAQGVAVRILVRHPLKVPESWARAGVDLVIGDVRDAGVWARALRDVDVVQHCAAAVGPHVSRHAIYATNRNGVRTLLEAVRQAVPARVVLVSSINVLGTRHLQGATEELPYRRSHDPAADVKIEAEQLALDYQRRGVAVTIVRPGFIYGPGDPHNLPRLLSALEHGRFAFIGSRRNIVPIVQVRDVARALVQAGRTPQAAGRIYHIADGSRTTIGEFVDELARLSGCSPPRRVLPFVVPLAGCLLFETLERLGLRHGAAPINRSSLRFLGTSRHIDIGRARQELGYAPQIGYRVGLLEAVRFYQAQREGAAQVA